MLLECMIDRLASSCTFGVFCGGRADASRGEARLSAFGEQRRRCAGGKLPGRLCFAIAEAASGFIDREIP